MKSASDTLQIFAWFFVGFHLSLLWKFYWLNRQWDKARGLPLEQQADRMEHLLPIIKANAGRQRITLAGVLIFMFGAVIASLMGR